MQRDRVDELLEGVILCVAQLPVDRIVQVGLFQCERSSRARLNRVHGVLHRCGNLHAVVLHKGDEVLHGALVVAVLLRLGLLRTGCLDLLHPVEQVLDLHLLIIPQLVEDIEGVRSVDRVLQFVGELVARLCAVQHRKHVLRNVKVVLLHKRNNGVQSILVLGIRCFRGELRPLVHLFLGALSLLIGVMRLRRGAIQPRGLSALYVVAVAVESCEPDFFASISRS